MQAIEEKTLLDTGAVPVISMEQLVAESRQREAYIKRVKEAVSEQFNNLDNPEPFVPQAPSIS